jgi:hypothetical protein
MPDWKMPAELGADAVDERFRQAKRRGTPAWLWPEIAIDAWRAALERIAEIARHALAGKRTSLPVTADPAAFCLACYTSGMGPLLAYWLERGLIDTSPEIANLLDLHWHHNRVRHRRLTATGTDIIRQFDAAGIPIAVLKGMHTAAAYFPDEGTRPMADIDLLVAEGDIEGAAQILSAAGLVPGARGRRETHWHPSVGDAQLRTLMFVHKDDPWAVDLHHSLDQFVAAGAPLVRFDAAGPLRRTAPLADLAMAGGLGQPLLLLHLAAHAGGAMHNLTLLRLVELCFVIRTDEASGRLYWPELIAIGMAIDALPYAYPALKLCEALIPGTVPGWVLDRCAATVPARVVRVVDRLRPATAQRVERSSISEHFMWTAGWTGTMRQLAADLAPATRSWRGAWSIYERRVWQVLRGRVDA